MNAIKRENFVTVDLLKPLQREMYGTLLAAGDENANQFGAYIKRNGKYVDLSGYKAYGLFIRSDGVTVPLNGENMTVMQGFEVQIAYVYVDLSASCYACDGPFTLSIQLANDDHVHTVRMVDGYVRRTATNTFLVTDETTINVAEIKAMQAELDSITNPGTAADLLEGKEMIDADGKKVTGTIPTLNGRMVYPTVSNAKVVPQGTYVTGDIWVKGDNNLVPGNIKAGVTILGVVGTYEGG